MIGLFCFVLAVLVPRPDVSMVSINPDGCHDFPTSNAGAVASGRLSSLLALEIELAGDY
jgi:hypothetical protein